MNSSLASVAAFESVLPQEPVPTTDAPTFGVDGHSLTATLTTNAVPAETIAAIRMVYRQRQDLLSAEKRLTLQIKSICRRFVGGDIAEADALYRSMLKGDANAVGVGVAVTCLLTVRDSVSRELNGLRRECETAAKALPVAPFVEATFGFGYLGLAQIVGEAGDLSNYANPGKLWRRFGVAPFKGRAPSQWRIRGGLTAPEFVEMGYSARRRSVLFSIGDALIKKQGPYREVYLARKVQLQCRAIEAGKRVLPAAKIPKGDPECVSDMHIHRAAQMYMEKRLLRELWRAWRGQGYYDDQRRIAAPASPHSA